MLWDLQLLSKIILQLSVSDFVGEVMHGCLSSFYKVDCLLQSIEVLAGADGWG